MGSQQPVENSSDPSLGVRSTSAGGSESTIASPAARPLGDSYEPFAPPTIFEQFAPHGFELGSASGGSLRAVGLPGLQGPPSPEVTAAVDEVVQLLDAWTFNTEERRILAIIEGLPDHQIDAFLGELRSRGYLEKLFDDMHGAEYTELLRLVTEKGGRAMVSSPWYDQVLGGLVRGVGGFVGSLVDGVKALFQKETWVGLADLGQTLYIASDPHGILSIVMPDKVAEARQKLSSMFEALKAQVIADWDAAGAQGTRVELATKWATQGILDIATLFVGVGEVKAAISGTRLGAKLAQTLSAFSRFAAVANKVDNPAQVIAAIRRAHPEKADEMVATYRQIQAAVERGDDVPPELLAKFEPAELEAVAKILEDAGDLSDAKFVTKGLDVDPATVPEGLQLIEELAKANPNMDATRVLDLARDMLSSGRQLPRVVQAAPDTVLYKIVPENGKLTSYTPYWFSEAELTAIKRMPHDQIADWLGLPAGSEGQLYTVYKIRPRAGEAPKVFESTIAPTVEGLVERRGGATQTLVPNRGQWTDAVADGTIGGS